jgi:hypothetical protein
MTTDFGTDTSCTDELRPGAMVTGTRLVAEACYRRLTTPRGMLRGGEDEANYGMDLPSLVGSVKSKAEQAALPGRIRSELEKDERIESLDINCVASESGGLVSFEITIDAQTGAGPFRLVLHVSSVTVELLGIE